MHELVSQFIDKKKAEEREKFEKVKAQKLIDLGMYDKEFPPDPQNIDYKEYDCYYYDSESGTSKHYKKTPVDVTDEEYAEILKYSKEDNDETNVISMVLKVFAWLIFIGGFIIGCVNANVETGYYYTRTEFSFAIAMVYWAVSLFSGVSLLGFAKIIDLLEDIKNNTNK